MSRTLWAWARLVAPAAILAVLVWRLGTGPFLDGIRTIDRWSLTAAAGIAVLTTVCSAWRWRIVARGLKVDLPLGTAVAAYYRSVFLNTTLPGGVLGDLHRGVRHGREVGDVGRALRAVGWERAAGQVVQAALTGVVLLVLPSPVRPSMPAVALAVVGVTLGVVLMSRSLPRRGPSRWARTVRAAGADLRDGLLARGAWPGILVTSALVIVGHTATFLIAARTAGVTVSLPRLLPLALLILVGAALPSVAGWGPREGVAAWTFGAAGLGAAQGVATAVVYGVMVVVANSPGAALLLVGWLRQRNRDEKPVQPPDSWRVPVSARTDGASRG